MKKETNNNIEDIIKDIPTYISNNKIFTYIKELSIKYLPNNINNPKFFWNNVDQLLDIYNKLHVLKLKIYTAGYSNKQSARIVAVRDSKLQSVKMVSWDIYYSYKANPR